jgi:hypothetical protein
MHNLTLRYFAVSPELPLTQPSGKDPDPLSGVARDVVLAGQQLAEGIWELNDHPDFFCQ